MLIDNDRIGHVAEVAAAYRKLLQEQLGIRQAEIVTARELDAAERQSLVDEVGKLAGATIEASFKLDAASWAARWCGLVPRCTTARCADGWTG